MDEGFVEGNETTTSDGEPPESEEPSVCEVLTPIEKDLTMENAINGLTDSSSSQRLAFLRCIENLSPCSNIDVLSPAIESLASHFSKNPSECDAREEVALARAAAKLYIRLFELAAERFPHWPFPSEKLLPSPEVERRNGTNERPEAEEEVNGEKARKTSNTMTAIARCWEAGRKLKEGLVDRLESSDERCRAVAIKFAEEAILIQSQSTVQSNTIAGTFENFRDSSEFSRSLSIDPSSPSTPSKRLGSFAARAEKEAQELLDKLLALPINTEICTSNLIEILSAVANVAKQRPLYFPLILAKLKDMNQNFPPHLTEIEAAAIRKCMKANTLTMLKLPVAFQHLPEIRALLNGLGASSQEMRQLWKCFLRRKSTGGSFRSIRSTNEVVNDGCEGSPTPEDVAELFQQQKSDLKLLRSRSFPNHRPRNYFDTGPNAVARFAAMIEGENRELSLEDWVELANEMRRTKWGTVTVSCTANDFPPAIEISPETETEETSEMEPSNSSSCGVVDVDSDDSPPETPPFTPPADTAVDGNDFSLASSASFPLFEVDEKRTYTSRMKLLTEGDVQVCKIEQRKKLLHKILQNKLMYRWERHRLVLEDSAIVSRTPGSFMTSPIRYSVVEEVSLVPAPHSNGHKRLICIALHDASYFLKTSSVYLRDQWLQSISSRRSLYKYQQIFRCATRPEVKCREVRNMVQHVLSSPVQDTAMVCHVINGLTPWLPPKFEDDILVLIAPLLETTPPTKTLCTFFSDYCHRKPRSSLIPQLMTGVVEWILKRNADFGKHPYMRKLAQDFMGALYGQNNGKAAVEEFISRLHGPSSNCPHPRIMTNMVAISLAALHCAFTQNKAVEPSDENLPLGGKSGWDNFNLSLDVLIKIASFSDWRPGLAQILQPVPFSETATKSPAFLKKFADVVVTVLSDPHCDVHQLILPLRDGKDGWFDIYCPSRQDVDVDAAGCTETWTKALETLFNCCCRRKKFVTRLVKHVGTVELLALRGTPVAQEVLCFMLEFDMVDGEERQMQLVTTLESIASGRDAYSRLLERRSQLDQLRRKGGPRKLTMPSRSTDEDVGRLISSGSFGNLECLSLAFTNVTSACAEHLMKLLSLKYLNLWATRFDDKGLEVLCEHLVGLQVLNLCETPVTDKGLQHLASIKTLRKLNLNSTWLSSSTFDLLKRTLPELEEIDVRYTDAWR